MPTQKLSYSKVILIFAFSISVYSAASPRTYVVTCPVADLRSEPSLSSGDYFQDPLQESQILYGEHLKVIRTEDNWALVEATEQPEYTHNQKWQGYPGWVSISQIRPVLSGSKKADSIVVTKWARIWKDPQAKYELFDLPMGAKLSLAQTKKALCKVRLADGSSGWTSCSNIRPIRSLKLEKDKNKRNLITKTAKQLIGDNYLWGGRSPSENPKKGFVQTGMDCSGLVNLVYRTCAIEIPRDAHEQFMKSSKIKSNQIEAADLIFLSEKYDPKKIVHVMLYLGEDMLLEAPGTGKWVRIISSYERLGKSISEIQPGDTVENQIVFFGTYLK